MGGKGTYAVDNSVAYTYKTVGKIEGVKVLQGLGNLHDLPAEAHSSKAYILLGKNGVFKQMRVYNEKHEAIYEIGYHYEKSLGAGMILHAHIYSKPGDINHRVAEKFKIGPGNEYFEKYKKYFKGVKL